MGAAIFGLAGILMLGGLAALINAINLVPTDIGIAWLQIGFTLLSSGVIVMAIGMATRMLSQQKAAPAAARTEPALPDWSPHAAPSEHKPLVEASSDAAKGPDLAKAGIIAGAGVATGALIGSALSSDTASTQASNDANARGVDDFERDLFEDLLATSPVVAPSGNSELATQETAISHSEAGADKDNDADTNELCRDEDLIEFSSAHEDIAAPAATQADEDAEDKADDDHEQAPIDAPIADDKPVTASEKAETSGQALINLDEFELPPLPPILQPLAPSAPPAPVAIDIEIAPPLPPAPPEPVIIEPIAVVEPAAPSVPGLIPDADLEALTSGAPVLAPLETLDVVGSYDSGGTRFTMYSDGSVTAVGPTMDRRFVSLDALRKFIDGGAE